jgi:hypothetical protein
MAAATMKKRSGLAIPFRSDVGLEPALKPLVDSSHSTLWRKTLNVLCVRGPVLEFVDEIPVPVLVGIAGPVEGVDHFLELMKSRAESDLAKVGGALMQRFMPAVLAVFQDVKSTESPSEAAFAAGFAARFLGERETIMRWLYGELGAAVQGVVSVSDGVGAVVFETLREKRTAILTNVLEPAGFELMLQGLLRLHLIEPRIQSSLCGNCGHFAVTLSSTLLRTPHCPRCGSEWCSLTLYVFGAGLAPLKAANADLPLFVSSYLKSKCSRLMPLGEADVLPHALFGAPDRVEAEVDVFVPALKLGIECKQFEDAVAPMTRPRVSNMAGDLETQIRRYQKLGIKRVIVVSNLSIRSASKLESALHARLQPISSKENALAVVPGIPEALLGRLDLIANELSKKLTSEFAKRFAQSVAPGGRPGVALSGQRKASKAKR